MTSYLADTSVWSVARGRVATREKLADRIAHGQLVTCVPVVLEVLHSARNEDEYEEELTETFVPLDWLSFGNEAAARSFEVQRALARTTHGAHRIPTVDYFVAAIAEVAGEDVVLWHADRDLARLCEFVGQAHEHESLRTR